MTGKYMRRTGGVAVAVLVGVGVAVRVGVCVGVGVWVRVGVNVAVGVLVRVGVAVRVGVRVRVGVAVGGVTFTPKMYMPASPAATYAYSPAKTMSVAGSGRCKKPASTGDDGLPTFMAWIPPDAAT